MGIETFTLSVTELPYPAVTICKKNGLYDPGEYLRAVFNQFQYAYRKDEAGSCEKTADLRDHYRNFVSTCDRKPREIISHVEEEIERVHVRIERTRLGLGTLVYNMHL